MTENKKPCSLRHYIRIFSLYHCIFKYYDIDVLVCIIKKKSEMQNNLITVGSTIVSNININIYMTF